MLDGQLGAFNLKVGQSLVDGERVGQVDNLDSYKLEVLVDEFYINKVVIGQQAKFTVSGKEYRAEIDKISPEVNNGQFKVELSFVENQPENIRRGQTINLRLSLSESSNSLLLNAGSYMQDTGGQWLFVLDDDGQTAKKKMVRIGRSSPEYVEVLDGLEEGDEVITSSYQELRNFDNLVLQD
jgi:HlyD family secretion protein